MFCSHCGTQIDEGANFCKKCGTKLSQAGEPNPPRAEPSASPVATDAPAPQQIPPAQEKRGANMATLIAAGVAVVILGGAGVYFGTDMLRPAPKQETSVGQPPAAKPTEPVAALRSAPTELPPNVEAPKPPVEVLSRPSGKSDASVASRGGVTPGTYQTLRPTSVYEAPSPSAKVVANIDSGVPVNVVGSNGDWLEVRSKSGKPPGFIPRGDATLTEPSK